MSWLQQPNSWESLLPISRSTVATAARLTNSVCSVLGVLVRCMAPPAKLAPLRSATVPRFHLFRGLYAGNPVEGSMTGFPVLGCDSCRSSTFTVTVFELPLGSPKLSVSWYSCATLAGFTLHSACQYSGFSQTKSTRVILPCEFLLTFHS